MFCMSPEKQPGCRLQGCVALVFARSEHKNVLNKARSLEAAVICIPPSQEGYVLALAEPWDEVRSLLCQPHLLD